MLKSERKIYWPSINRAIDLLDLNVLSDNLPAKNLYLKSGFKIIGEMTDCYRIEGKDVSETLMTLCTKNHA